MAQEHAVVRGEALLLCVSGYFKKVTCLDPKTLQLKHEIPTPKGNYRVISIPPGIGREEELVAVGESDPDFEVHLHSPHQVDPPFRKLSASHSSRIWGLCWVPPRFVVSGSSEHAELVVSDVNSGEKVFDLKDAPEQTVRITTTASSARQEDVGGAPQRGNGFVFVGGGDLGDDNSIRHYDLGRSERTNEVVKKFEGHEAWAEASGYSTEKNLLFSSSPDETLRIWSVQNGKCLHTLQLSDESSSLRFDPKKHLIFCGVDGGIIEVWDYRQTRERVRVWKLNHPTNRTALSISDLCQIDDDTYASIGNEDFSVATWTERGKIIATTKTSGENYGVCCVGGTQGGRLRFRAQEERIGFLLFFSSVFWGVQVHAHGCFLRTTFYAMSHPTTD